MTNADTQVCREYVQLLLNRGTGGDDRLIPRSHVVNWDDQPSRTKIYTDVLRIPLSPELPARLLPMTDAAGEPGLAPLKEGPVSFRDLSTLLTFSYGILRRKFDVTWNNDHVILANHRTGRYSRAAASGGGLYPLEFYVVVGAGQTLTPGVYHYDNAHQALARLSANDVTPHLERALFGTGDSAKGMYLVITSYFWKNYFKYYDFCYHVVTQDTGAALGTLNRVAESAGIRMDIHFWFQDEAVNPLLGLRTENESALAVVSLGGQGVTARTTPLTTTTAPWEPLFERESYQRSKHLFRTPMLEDLHRSAIVDREPAPSAEAIAAAKIVTRDFPGEAIALPPAEAISTDILKVLHERHSSWGKFRSDPPMTLQETSTLLSYVSRAHRYHSDLGEGAKFTRLVLVSNHIQGVPKGIYHYEPEGHQLKTMRQGEIAYEMQRYYFLQNYNLEQAAGILAVVGKIPPMFDTFGNRGLRILNAEVGMLAQHTYMGAGALGLGCGVVLGFYNSGVNRTLQLDASDETSMLLMMVGHQVPATGFDFQMV